MKKGTSNISIHTFLKDLRRPEIVAALTFKGKSQNASIRDVKVHINY